MIFNFPAIVKNSERMIKASDILNIPVIATEQYPKAFGSTIESIKEKYHDNVFVFEKTKFSMITEEVKQKLFELNRK